MRLFVNETVLCVTWHEVPRSRLSQAGDGPDVAGQRRVWQSWLDEPRLGRLSEVLVTWYCMHAMRHPVTILGNRLWTSEERVGCGWTIEDNRVGSTTRAVVTRQSVTVQCPTSPVVTLMVAVPIT